jgi:hypothetical protein
MSKRNDYPMKMKYYVNLKNGKRYRVFDVATEATNAKETAQTVKVVYYDENKRLYVRDMAEFLVKFVPEEEYDPKLTLARLIRETWAEYVTRTCESPPKAWTTPWEETGEWGRNGNLAVAEAVIKFFNGE